MYIRICISYQFEKSTPNSGAAASAWFSRPISPLLAQTSVRTASKKREFANFKGRMKSEAASPAASSLPCPVLRNVSAFTPFRCLFPPSPSPILRSALQRISALYSTPRAQAGIGSRSKSFRSRFQNKTQQPVCAMNVCCHSRIII